MPPTSLLSGDHAGAKRSRSRAASAASRRPRSAIRCLMTASGGVERDPLAVRRHDQRALVLLSFVICVASQSTPSPQCLVARRRHAGCRSHAATLPEPGSRRRVAGHRYAPLPDGLTNDGDPLAVGRGAAPAPPPCPPKMFSMLSARLARLRVNVFGWASTTTANAESHNLMARFVAHAGCFWVLHPPAPGRR